MLTRRDFSACAATALMGGFPAAYARSEQIVLGQSAPFTGPAAELGIQFNAGAKLFFQLLNARGGIAGRDVQIRHLDDGYEPERCLANTRKLISEGVTALFGFVGTPTSIAALPLATQAKIPFVAPFTGAMALRVPFNRYAFHVRASYNDETALIVAQQSKLGMKRIAVFYQNDAYGRAGLEGVTRALAALKLKPVAIATVERNTVDVAQAVKTINASNPDAVVQVSAYKSCAAYIRAARKEGFSGMFYNVSFVGTRALQEELGRDGAGVVISQVMPSPYVPTLAIASEFQDAVRKSNGVVQANFSSMEGYVAASVMAEALRRANVAGTGLVDAFESIGNQSFGGFPVSFSPTNHAASRFVELSVLTADGQVRF
jgi:branched-chain amino acid transport system substrate-binding protein